MEQQLKEYMEKHYDKQPDLWLSEAFTLSCEETFQKAEYQQLFGDKELTHELYYNSEDNEPIFPFEVYDDQTLIALGYMIEDQQHILYLQHNNYIIINQL